MDLQVHGQKLKEPIFITGCGRSGTYLLLDIFGKNKNIYAIPKETHFFRDIKPKVYTLCNKFEKNGDIENLSLSILTIFSQGALNSYNVVNNRSFSQNIIKIHEEIRSLDEYKKAKSKIDIFNLCANFLTLKNNKKRWVEKTPGHIRTYFRILSEYPQAKLIGIFRDPRATYCSWKYSTVFKNSTMRNIIVFIIIWKIACRIAKHLLNLCPKQFYLVKYENIINNPTEEVAKLCNFVDEEYEKSMLDVETINSSFVQNEKGFIKDIIHKWKKLLSRYEILFIDTFTKKERSWLNYKDSDTAFNLGDYTVLPFFIFLAVLNIFVIAINKVILKSRFYLEQFLYEAGNTSKRNPA